MPLLFVHQSSMNYSILKIKVHLTPFTPFRPNKFSVPIGLFYHPLNITQPHTVTTYLLLQPSPKGAIVSNSSIPTMYLTAHLLDVLACIPTPIAFIKAAGFFHRWRFNTSLGRDSETGSND